MHVSELGKLSIFASIVSVSLIQGCNSEPAPTPPPAAPITPSAVLPADEAKIQKASGPVSNAAQDTTIIGTGKK